MVELSVKADIQKVVKQLTEAQRKHVPFATAKALTKTAQAAKEEIREEMKRKLDGPTTYTLNSLMMKPAKKNNLMAVVWIKDKLDAGKGNAPENFLGPQIHGGERKLKRFEVALRRKGILPDGMYAVPGAGADMDANGNMSRGQIVQILSYLQAFGEQGYKANMTAKRKTSLAKGTKAKQGFEYILVGPARGLSPGIWKRVSFGMGKAVKPVLIFVKKPTYRKRVPFFDVAKRVQEDRFVKEFRAALALALATAR